MPPCAAHHLLAGASDLLLTVSSCLCCVAFFRVHADMPDGSLRHGSAIDCSINEVSRERGMMKLYADTERSKEKKRRLDKDWEVQISGFRRELADKILSVTSLLTNALLLPADGEKTSSTNDAPPARPRRKQPAPTGDATTAVAGFSEPLQVKPKANKPDTCSHCNQLCVLHHTLAISEQLKASTVAGWERECNLLTESIEAFKTRIATKEEKVEEFESMIEKQLSKVKADTKIKNDYIKDKIKPLEAKLQAEKDTLRESIARLQNAQWVASRKKQAARVKTLAGKIAVLQATQKAVWGLGGLSEESQAKRGGKGQLADFDVRIQEDLHRAKATLKKIKKPKPKGDGSISITEPPWFFETLVKPLEDAWEECDGIFDKSSKAAFAALQDKCLPAFKACERLLSLVIRIYRAKTEVEGMTHQLEGADVIRPHPKPAKKPDLAPNTLLPSSKTAAAIAAARAAATQKQGNIGMGQEGVVKEKEEGTDLEGADGVGQAALQHLVELEDGSWVMGDILTDKNEPVLWRSSVGTLLALEEKQADLKMQISGLRACIERDKDSLRECQAKQKRAQGCGAWTLCDCAGQLVCLSEGFETVFDAALGGLRQGDVGEIVAVEPVGSVKPFKVRNIGSGAEWWYAGAALSLAPVGSAESSTEGGFGDAGISGGELHAPGARHHQGAEEGRKREGGEEEREKDAQRMSQASKKEEIAKLRECLDRLKIIS